MTNAQLGNALQRTAEQAIAKEAAKVRTATTSPRHPFRTPYPNSYCHCSSCASHLQPNSSLDLEDLIGDEPAMPLPPALTDDERKRLKIEADNKIVAEHMKPVTDLQAIRDDAQKQLLREKAGLAKALNVLDEQLVDGSSTDVTRAMNATFAAASAVEKTRMISRAFNDKQQSAIAKLRTAFKANRDRALKDLLVDPAAQSQDWHVANLVLDRLNTIKPFEQPNSTYVFSRITPDEMHPILMSVANVALRYYSNNTGAVGASKRAAVISALDRLSADPHFSNMAVIARVLSRDISHKVNSEPVQMFQKIFARAVQRAHLASLRHSTASLAEQLALYQSLNASTDANVTAKVAEVSTALALKTAQQETAAEAVNKRIRDRKVMIADVRAMKAATESGDDKAYVQAQAHAAELGVKNSTLHSYLLNEHRQALKQKRAEEQQLKDAVTAGENAAKQALEAHKQTLAAEDLTERAQRALKDAEKEEVNIAVQHEKKKQELSVMQVKNSFLAPTLQKGGLLEQAIRDETQANWTVTHDTTKLRECREALSKAWTNYDMVLVTKARECVKNYTEVVARAQVHYGLMQTVRQAAVVDVERLGKQQFDVDQLSKSIESGNENVDGSVAAFQTARNVTRAKAAKLNASQAHDDEANSDAEAAAEEEASQSDEEKRAAIVSLVDKEKAKLVKKLSKATKAAQRAADKFDETKNALFCARADLNASKLQLAQLNDKLTTLSQKMAGQSDAELSAEDKALYARIKSDGGEGLREATEENITSLTSKIATLESNLTKEEHATEKTKVDVQILRLQVDLQKVTVKQMDEAENNRTTFNCTNATASNPNCTGKEDENGIRPQDRNFILEVKKEKYMEAAYLQQQLDKIKGDKVSTEARRAQLKSLIKNQTRAIARTDVDIDAGVKEVNRLYAVVSEANTTVDEQKALQLKAIASLDAVEGAKKVFSTAQAVADRNQKLSHFNAQVAAVASLREHRQTLVKQRSEARKSEFEATVAIAEMTVQIKDVHQDVLKTITAANLLRSRYNNASLELAEDAVRNITQNITNMTQHFSVMPLSGSFQPKKFHFRDHHEVFACSRGRHQNDPEHQ